MTLDHEKLIFRKAKPEDFEAVCKLIYESGKLSFDYSYTIKHYTPLGFIKFCFRNGNGFLGYKKQTIGEIDGKIVFTGTSYIGQEFIPLVKQTLVLSYRYYGWMNATRLLLRGVKIANLFVRPKSDSLYLANLCTDQSVRGLGVFKTYYNLLLQDAVDSEIVNQIELDVAADNHNAFAAYKKLGFKIIQQHKYKGNDSRITDTIRMEHLL